ncbi:MAG: hypothetical protein NXI30_19500 [bacterium]|nr:hypothetical protein [bacterium]
MQIRLSEAPLIALDGLPGAGKSTLAIRLSADLGVKSVHLDDYLVPNGVGYTNRLEYRRIRRALSVRPVIVEGVCMLDVLDRMGLHPDQLIYLRAPCSARYLDVGHPLVREVNAYSDRARPMEKATFVLLRTLPEQQQLGGLQRYEEILDAHLSRNRTRISRLLAIAGVVTLAMGGLAAIVPSSGTSDGYLLRIAGARFSISDIGLLTMLISGLSLFLTWSGQSPNRRRSPSPRRR